MARKQETKKYRVDDSEVEVTLMALGGMEGSMLGLRIGEILGPALGTLVAALDHSSPQGIGDALRALFDKLTPAQFKTITAQLMKGAQINIGDEFHDLTVEKIDDVFSGNVSAVYKLVFDAVRLNFSNFSQGLGADSENMSKLMTIVKSRALKAMQEPQTPSPKESTPLVGASS